MEVLTNIIVVSISQYKHVSDYHIPQLKVRWYMSIISQ